MTHDDETVERVARAINAARYGGFNDTRDPPAFEDEDKSGQVYAYRLARAALSAMPHAALMREALTALEPFAKSAQRDWDDDAEDDTEIWSSQGPGWSVSRDCYTVGELRRARAAAQRLRDALTQSEQEQRKP